LCGYRPDGGGIKMLGQWCNTENYGGGEAHYAHRSSFDWITIGDKALWVCEDCKYELASEEEEE
jgi:hypothetical protein